MASPLRKLAELKNRRQEIRYIRPHFDAAFYLRCNADVAHAGVDPVSHYVRYGAAEGRDPAPGFSTLFYLRQNGDVARTGMNAYYHYLRYGKPEGRTSVPASGNEAGAETEAEAETGGPQAASGLRPFDAGWFDGLDAAFLRDRRGIDLAGMARRRDPGCDLDLALVRQSPERIAPPGPDGIFVDRMLAQLSGKTLSLDIWDTVLRRTCHPDEVKLRAARALWLRVGHENAALADLHPLDVLRLRAVAEAAVADDAWEYRFEPAAEVWLRMLGGGAVVGPDQVMATELAIEKACAYADPTILALRQAHRGPVIAVSDFYLPGPRLAEILADRQAWGPDADGARIYVSCDAMATKRRGDLFDHVLRAEGLAADRLLHLGDRLDADVERPREQGVPAALYESPDDLARIEGLNQRFEAHRQGDLVPHSAALLAAALDGGAQSGDAPKDETPFGEALPAEALAVVVTGFVLHVLEEAVRRRVGVVHFFTREGVFFKQIYDDLVAADVFDLGAFPGAYPPSALLEVSRRATFAASLENLSVPQLMRLWSQYSSQSMRALAVTLNIDPADWATAAARNGIDLDEVIRYPWQDKRIRAFLADPGLRKPSQDSLTQQRKGLLEYLEAKGFAPGAVTRRLVVDIGWRGTIQDNLATVCAGSIHGCYLGLDRFLNRQPVTATKSAFLMDANQAGAPTYAISEYAALEFICNAPGGSVVGYSHGQARREILPGEEQVIIDRVLPLQARIRAACQRVGAYVRTHGLIAADLKPLARTVTRDYIARPDAGIAGAFTALEHNETFGTGTSDRMDGAVQDLAALPDLRGADFNEGMRKALSTLRWPEAHRATDPLRGLIAGLDLDQRLALPRGPGAPMLMRGGADGTACVLAPMPIKGSGGHRTIYNLARKLAQAGFHVHLMNQAPADPASMEWQQEVIAGAGLRLHNSWYAGVHAGAAIATIDYSTFYAREFYAEKAKLFYFIQDYEAKFNPVGDTYLRSQRSFAQGAHAITIGRWLSHVLRVQYGQAAASGGLGVDHGIYRPLTVLADGTIPVRRRQIAFLHQPEKFRRAPDLCVAALAEVKRRLPDVEVVTYGSDAHPQLPFRARHLGLVRDLNMLNEIYNASQLGLCISATNPSRIPFEMMAAGCIPVDIYAYNNLFDYGAGCGVLAYQSAESLAEAMCRVLTDEDFRTRRVAKGLSYAQNRSLDWETDVAANVVGHVLAGGALDDLPMPEPSYTDAPILALADSGPAARAFVDWQWQLASMRPGRN